MFRKSAGTLLKTYRKGVPLVTQPDVTQPGLGFPPQHQTHQPGIESEMSPLPLFEDPKSTLTGQGKLSGKVAVITGGDSGIGRAVAIAFAKEGADIVLVYLHEHDDARLTQERIEQLGQRCISIAGDVGNAGFCQHIITKTIDTFHGLHIVVNNAAVRLSILRPSRPTKVTRNCSTTPRPREPLSRLPVP